MLEVDKSGINDEGGFSSYRYEVEVAGRVREQKKRVINAYYKLTKFGETTHQFIDRLNADDYNYPHILEKYKRELKKSFCLPVNYEPKKQKDLEVKYVKRTTQYVPNELSPQETKEKLERQHEEYLERVRQEKIEKVRKERELEKKKKMVEKELNKGKKKRS